MTDNFLFSNFISNSRYLSGLDEFYEPGNKWQQWYTKDSRMKGIKNLASFIDDEGNLRNNINNNALEEHIKTVIKAFNNDKSYKNYNYDKNRKALDNFKNLRKLSKNK